jgi:hypothetical protein
MLSFFCTVKTNDMMLVIYLSSLIRSVIALHNLINNKVGCFYLLLVLFQSLGASLVDFDVFVTLTTSNEITQFCCEHEIWSVNCCDSRC